MTFRLSLFNRQHLLPRKKSLVTDGKAAPAIPIIYDEDYDDHDDDHDDHDDYDDLDYDDDDGNRR